MNALKKARADVRIAHLLNDVQKKVQIRYAKSSRDLWASNMEGGAALIEYAECLHPSSGLAHELLHLDTQLSGFRRLRIVRSNIDNTASFSTLLSALDNELQHHKFYQKYLSLGFAPKYFYCDADASTEQHLRDVSQASFGKFIDVVPQFLTAIAPGGKIEPAVQAELRDAMLSVNSGEFSERLVEIEEHIKSWTSSSTYDGVDVVRKVMLTIQPDNNLTWIGFDRNDNSPGSGFYVDAEFNYML